MAGAFKTWLSDMAKIIKVKTGKLTSEKIKPFDYPDLIASISGGSGNVRVDMGRVTFTSSDIVNGVATFEHNLGIMPDYILFFALDSPDVTSSDNFHPMGYAGVSKALAERALETNPNISTTGFIISKSYVQGKPDNGYTWIQSLSAGYYYENWIASKGSSNAGVFGGIYDVTINDISFGSSDFPMKPGREFFYALIGNLL